MDSTKLSMIDWILFLCKKQEHPCLDVFQPLLSIPTSSKGWKVCVRVWNQSFIDCHRRLRKLDPSQLEPLELSQETSCPWMRGCVVAE